MNREVTVPQAGSERDRAASALFVQHYDSLRRLACFLLGDPAQAEEVVMDCFTKALARWGLVKGTHEPHAYLRRMVINRCRSKQRRRAVEARVTSLLGRSAEHHGVELQGVELHGLALDVWDAVRALPERPRTAVLLRYLEDLKEAEIAEAMDCPLGTVKSLLSRARTRLSEELGPEFFGGGA